MCREHIHKVFRPRRLYKAGQIVAVGYKGVPIGEDASQAKFLDEDVSRVFELREKGYSFGQISKKLDMSKSNAWRIFNARIRDQIPVDYKQIYKSKRRVRKK